MNHTSKFYINLVLIILFVVVRLTVVGQELQASFLPLPEELNFEKSNAAQQSIDGKLWFATDSGLFSYDGLVLEAHLTNEAVTDLFIMNDHTIGYIKQHQLFAIDKKLALQDKTYEFTETEEFHIEKHLLFENDWGLFETADKQLLLYDEALSALPIHTDTILCLSKGLRAKEAWLVSEQGNLLEISGGKVVSKGKVKIPEGLFKIEIVDDQTLLLVGKHEIRYLATSNDEQVLSLKDSLLYPDAELVELIPLFKEGYGVLTDQHELFLIDRVAEHQIELLNLSIKNIGYDHKRLTLTQAQLIFESVDKGFWLYNQAGLAHLKINPFIRVSESFAYGVRGITSNGKPEEKLYIATGNAFSIDIRNYDSLLIENMDIPIPRQELVNKVINVGNQMWLAASGGGLYVMENHQLVKHLDLSERGSEIFNLYGDTKGQVWLCQAPHGKQRLGILRVDQDFNLKEYPLQGEDILRVAAVVEANQQLYITGQGATTYLYRFDASADTFQNISLPLPLPVQEQADFDVYDMGIDTDGIIWLATNEGLLRQEKDTIQKISLGDLELLECTQLAVAPDNSVWVGTNGYGVFHYKDGYYASYGAYEGVPSKTSSFRSMLFDQKGRLWFGTNEGLVISQLKLPTSVNIPTPELKYIEASYRKYNFAKEDLELPYNTPIRFVVESISFPVNRKRYEYEIFRLQKGRKELVIEDHEATSGEILIHPLTGGSYELRVRSEQMTGQMRSKPLVYHFSVQPIWYKRPWVLVAFFLLVALTVIILIKWNTIRLEEANMILEEMVNERTKELVQSEKELKLNAEELKAINKNLERTQDNLKQALEKEKESKRELEETYKTLQETKDQLIESEKLAALGNLLAGVAHEVNSPLAAIHASSENLLSKLDLVFDSFPKTFSIFSSEQQRHILTLLQKSIAANGLEIHQGRRAVRKKLENGIKELDISEARQLSESLLQLGIEELTEEIIPILESPVRKNLLSLTQQLTTFIKSARNVNYGSERALKIVAALKNYSRTNTSTEMHLSSLKDGIENTLILYQHQIKQHTTLNWEYDELPNIYCYPDELNQVWTNLINNAIYAMEGMEKSHLDVQLRLLDDHGVVTISDNGKGIPEEIKEHIFEPFFTTKPQGEGTGIGLDVVKKIIEKHEGMIVIKSKVGEGTTVQVTLPLREQVD